MISFRDASYTYSIKTPFEKLAVKNVSFDLNEGEIVGIIGHTGSGKSTLIQMMDALLLPTSGEVYINCTSVQDKKANLKQLRANIGMVFQYPEVQIFEETIFDEVAFGPKNQGISGEELEQRVSSACAVVGLNSGDYKKSPLALSGGQKRKVAIASVLSMKPKVLILDEPTAGLDPRARNSLLKFLKEYNKKFGVSIVMVSHSMEEIAEIADRVLVLNKGEIVMDDATNNVFARREFLKSVGLDIPEISTMMNMLGVTDCWTVSDAILRLKSSMTVANGKRAEVVDAKEGGVGSGV